MNAEHMTQQQISDALDYDAEKYSRYWTQQEALALCVQLEPIAEKCGGHVALTGGALYKRGLRKDVDIIVYRVRQVEQFNWPLFFSMIKSRLGIVQGTDYGWCKKAALNGRVIDFFDPDEDAFPDTPNAGSDLL